MNVHERLTELFRALQYYYKTYFIDLQILNFLASPLLKYRRIENICSLTYIDYGSDSY